MSEDKKNTTATDSGSKRFVESVDRSTNAETRTNQPIAVQRLDPAPTSPPGKTAEGDKK